MRNIRRTILFLLLILGFALAGSALGAGKVTVHLVNATPGGPTVIGVCPGAQNLIVQAGRHAFCRTIDPAGLVIGVMGGPQGALDATREGPFDIRAGKSTVLRGTVETVVHITPGIVSHYVYVWQVEEGAQ